MKTVPEKISDFFASYPLQQYTKRELLIRAEEPIRSVFFIADGRVSQYDIAPNGNEVVVNIFKPGAFFPMSSAINNTSNHYFFEASTKTSVRVAPQSEVVAFLKENPDVVFDLLARVYSGVDGVLRRMAHLMGGDALSRLIFELLNAAYRFGELQEDGSVRVPLTESDIGKHSGLARETVSRLLQELKADGYIEIIRGKVVIASTRKLESRLGNNL